TSLTSTTVVQNAKSRKPRQGHLIPRARALGGLPPGLPPPPLVPRPPSPAARLPHPLTTAPGRARSSGGPDDRRGSRTLGRLRPDPRQRRLLLRRVRPRLDRHRLGLPRDDLLRLHAELARRRHRRGAARAVAVPQRAPPVLLRPRPRRPGPRAAARPA